MRRMLTLLALAAALPAAAEDLSVTAVLDEAGELAGRARQAYGPAQAMKPSLERNAVLSEIRKNLKLSLDKYRTAREISPGVAKAVDAAVTDLESMLFSCNKSMVVSVVPAAPSPAAVPSPVPPAPGEAPAALPAPVALSEAEVKEVETLLRALSELFKQVEEGRDLVGRIQLRIRDVYAVLSSNQKEWEDRHVSGYIKWTQVLAYEALREKLRESARKYQKQMNARMHEVAAWESQARCRRNQLEYYGPRALPVLSAFAAKGAAPPPEGMVDYLNRQLTRPEFAFTAVPREAPFPEASKADAAAANAARTLLNDLSESLRKEADAAVTLAESELDAERISKDLELVQSHFEWRQKCSSWCMDDLKKNDAFREASKKALEKLGSEKVRLTAERSSLAGRIGDLRARLSGLDPACVRVVEDWRRKQSAFPEGLVEDLEAWTRKVLGAP